MVWQLITKMVKFEMLQGQIIEYKGRIFIKLLKSGRMFSKTAHPIRQILIVVDGKCLDLIDQIDFFGVILHQRKIFSTQCVLAFGVIPEEIHA